ncbi:carbohydrate kinase family protein [Paenibacillus sp. CAU 1782]
MFEFNATMNVQKKSNDLLTIGELLVDLISDHYDGVTQEGAYRKYFGGAPANIAMNTRKLGIRSQIAAAVGKDQLGDFLLRRVRQEGIEPELIERVDHATSMVLLTKSKASPIPVFYRSADYQLELTEGLKRTLLQSSIFHFSSWPISMRPARETIEQALELAARNHILVGFDPNYHPMLWQGGEDGPAYIKDMISKVDIVKPSEDDAERLFGADTPHNQIRKFLDLGAKLVIMTLGKDGAIVSNGDEWLNFPSLATEVEDTTGAGDAFWSGFYSALIKGYTLKESLNLGFAVSAFKLKYTGAVVDLPLLEKIKNLYFN